MALLQVKSVTKRFAPETVAVDDVSFAIEAGEIICLLGPSGCGKTTLLRLVAGLETPDSGEIWFNGKNIVGMPPHRHDFGMVFQDFALFPHKNVFENVAFGLQMRGDSPERIEKRVTEMLDLVDLRQFEQRDVGQLSGGEQQRVALARSLAPDPVLLMLDEPLGALDRALRERLMIELRAILKQVGVTAVYVTHDQTEAFAVADRLVVMDDGRIEQIGSPQDVYRRPATPFVAHFLGFHNLVEGRVTGTGKVKTPLGCLKPASPLPAAGEKVILLIKPDAATLSAKESAGHNNQIEGIVQTISFRGRYYQVWLRARVDNSLMFELSSIEGYEIGDRVCVALATEQMVVL